MDVSAKLCRKTLAQDIFDRRWSLRHWSNYQCEINSFVYLHSEVGTAHCVVDHNPNKSHCCHCCHFLR